ncbi:hypothetical protein [Vulcanococcus sp. Clear-D1]|uniref:hypothetical protein n=1 Tax=Vulcanococcus sp. Clear-D1 TaxID=2766970 RepID=UPI0019BEA67F|nr:hypothetical protein [Vulcanococcus sp. Clear-D1]MBD1193163.1 hypothetical protein [Vulcanococcus sp. Clear-D1]
MDKTTTGALLRLESDVLQPAAGTSSDGRELLVSVNPDLKSDFGHYLNYEKRLAEACSRLGLDHIGLASRELAVQHPGVVPAFQRESGHYAMVRGLASGQQATIAMEFRQELLAVLKPLQANGRWSRLHVFVYCGSSRLAMEMAQFDWPEGVTLCINAFWDFLIDGAPPDGLSGLCFQRAVRLLAMSDLHARNWHAASGLRFDWIPNPPPLLGDSDAYDSIRRMFGAARGRDRMRVLVPGLMTVGKGQETTGALLEHLRQYGTGGRDYVFRDRKSELGIRPSDPVHVLTGDLSDEQVIELYRSSDVVLLPYEAPTFAVRTSGALVDALVFGAVPLVLGGTWLAHQCRQYGVGRILPDAHPATVLAALAAVEAELAAERRRVPRAGALYLAHNTWSELVRSIVHAPATYTQPASGDEYMPPEASLFAAANRMLRLGRHAEAAQLYAWLSATLPLAIYQSNLQLCAKRSGRTVDELLSSTS